MSPRSRHCHSPEYRSEVEIDIVHSMPRCIWHGKFSSQATHVLPADNILCPGQPWLHLDLFSISLMRMLVCFHLLARFQGVCPL